NQSTGLISDPASMRRTMRKIKRESGSVLSRTALMAIRHRSQPTRSKQGYALEKVLNGCPVAFKERHANV
ncbi:MULTISPECIES: hypothetical protein, partial [Brucella]